MFTADEDIAAQSLMVNLSNTRRFSNTFSDPFSNSIRLKLSVRHESRINLEENATLIASMTDNINVLT